MRTAGIGLFALAPLVAACGSSPASPEPARTTETITTLATLLVGGITVYPTGFPTIVVKQSGKVDATVTFTPTADCQFIFSVCSATIASSCGTPALELESPRGRGPTLSVTGTLAPDTYYLTMSARVGGVPLCTTVPSGGLALPYTVVVTHP